MTPYSDTGGITGDPGWLLERRDNGAGPVGYEGWPPGAAYRAAVDGDAYALKYPEAYYGKSEFSRFVGQALAAYLERNPERRSELIELCHLMRTHIS